MCSVRALWSKDHDPPVSETSTTNSVTEILFHAIPTRSRPQLLPGSNFSRVYAELYVITISSSIDNTLLGNELIYVILGFFSVLFDMPFDLTTKETSAEICDGCHEHDMMWPERTGERWRRRKGWWATTGVARTLP